MRRRHVLALVVLALVVATVLAVGRVRVWDALTLRTVFEESWPNGQLKIRCKRRLWEPELRTLPDRSHTDYEAWHENGQKAAEHIRAAGVVRAWSSEGRLESFYIVEGGRMTGVHGWPRKKIRQQDVYLAGDQVDIKRSPPWFTEEEILQAVEGIELPGARTRFPRLPKAGDK